MNRMRELLFLGGLVVAFDQLSKYWLLYIYDVSSHTPVVLCEYFSLVMAWNRGVSFSMFSSHATWVPWALSLLAVSISALLIRLSLRSEQPLERVGYAFVVGGAMSNVIDRVRFGVVADFFYAHVGNWGWPAFNIADSAICLGAGVLLFLALKKPAKS